MWLGRYKELAVSAVDEGSYETTTSLPGKSSALHQLCLPDCPCCQSFCVITRTSFSLPCFGDMYWKLLESWLFLFGKLYATTTTEMWNTLFKLYHTSKTGGTKLITLLGVGLRAQFWRQELSLLVTKTLGTAKQSAQWSTLQEKCCIFWDNKISLN